MGCIFNKDIPYLFLEMHIFKDLLETYSDLRKRRYSLSERLILEGVNSAYNVALGPLNLLGQRGAEVDSGKYIEALTAIKTAIAGKAPPYEYPTLTTVRLPRTGQKTIELPVLDVLKDIDERIRVHQSEGAGKKSKTEEKSKPQRNTLMANGVRIPGPVDGLKNIGVLSKFEGGRKNLTAEHAIHNLNLSIMDSIGVGSKRMAEVISALGGTGNPVAQQCIDEFLGDLDSVLGIVRKVEDYDGCIPPGMVSTSEKDALSKFYFRSPNSDSRQLRYGDAGAGFFGGSENVPCLHQQLRAKLSGDAKALKTDRRVGVQISATRDSALQNALFTLTDSKKCEDGEPLINFRAASSGGFSQARGALVEATAFLYHLMTQRKKAKAEGDGEKLNFFTAEIGNILYGDGKQEGFLPKLKRMRASINAALGGAFVGKSPDSVFITEEIQELFEDFKLLDSLDWVSGNADKAAIAYLSIHLLQTKQESDFLTARGGSAPVIKFRDEAGKDLGSKTGAFVDENGVSQHTKTDATAHYENPEERTAARDKIYERVGVNSLEDPKSFEDPEATRLNISYKATSPDSTHSVLVHTASLAQYFAGLSEAEMSENTYSQVRMQSIDQLGKVLKEQGHSKKVRDGMIGNVERVWKEEARFTATVRTALASKKTPDVAGNDGEPRSVEELVGYVESVGDAGGDITRVDSAKEALKELLSMPESGDTTPLASSQRRCEERLKALWVDEKSRKDSEFPRYWAANIGLTAHTTQSHVAILRETAGRSFVVPERCTTLDPVSEILDPANSDIVRTQNGVTMYRGVGDRKVSMGSAGYRHHGGAYKSTWEVSKSYFKSWAEGGSYVEAPDLRLSHINHMIEKLQILINEVLVGQ